MSRWIRSATLLATACVVSTVPAGAQEFRIYTRIEDESRTGSDGKPEILGRALSLFHAGKVYDYIDTTVDGEVIVFEPTLSRFTILNTARGLCATVHFDELNHRLALARGMAEDYLAELQNHPSPPPPRVVGGVRFGLDPVFEEEWNPQRRTLTLAGEYLTYRVACVEPRSPEMLEAYLSYADWMARLNYALHPHAPFPEARLRLNESLRRHAMLPIEVRLETELSHPGRLRAEHQIKWQLDAKDRSLIHEWRTAIDDPETKRVTFQEYQRLVLLGAAGPRR